MKIRKLNKVYLEEKIEAFIDLIKDVPNEYWEGKHFLIELNDKWKYSLVVENESEILGYIIASNKIKSIHIHKFMVKHTHRSLGIGRLLLNEYEANCLLNGHNLITLKVYKKNERAICFYLDKGFNIENDSDNDLYTMSKNLV